MNGVVVSRVFLARIRLRQHFAKLFSGRKSSLSPEQAGGRLMLRFQVVKGMHPLYTQAKEKERDELIRECKFALAAYLDCLAW